MKKSAKILSIILAVIMVLSVIPMAAFADSSDFVISDAGVLTAYNGAGGDIVIPDGVTAIGDGVFHGNTSITSVKFPSSVKTIGYASFRECTSLQTVTFSEGLETLGERSFQLCDNIQTLELPSSLRTICKEALTLMNGIKNLVIPEGVTTIENLALGCLCYLESISFPASATSIGFALFRDCERLASVTVDPANPVYDSRDNCNAIIETATNTLVSGSISTVIPDSVTSIGPLSFEQMTGLESITIPDSVTSIGPSAFQYCYSLKSITIPDSVTSIGMGTFAYDDQLTSVTLHDGITSIGDGAFDNYGKLKTVYYPCDDNVETIKGFMSPHGTFTYTPIHDEITYTDNGDGTHTGSCACGSFKTEKEDHTFVDGVCTFCGAEEPELHIHSFDMAWTTNATAHWHACIMGGCDITDYSTVEYSYYGLHEFENGKCKVCDYECEHPNKYTVPAKEVTCTEDGHSAYLYCPDCEEALEIYDVYVAINHAHSEIVDGVAATCTEEGLTDGKYCPDCETWLIPQETIPAINHANAEIVNGKAATCTESGLTDGTFCPDCETWIIPREVIPATNHPNAYNENGEAETCSSSGVTPGVYCPDCEKYISGRETIEPHPHPLADEYIDNEDGTHSQHCTECGEPIIVSEHTFVNGVCVCGAKEPNTEAEIISITEKSDAIIGETVDLEVLISKPVKKLQFADKDGNTFTYATTSANTVSVVNNDDGTQVWTVKLTVRHSDDEYTVNAKERSSGSWSEKTYDLKIEGKKPPVYDEIISVEVSDEANNEIKYGTHDIIITTGKDVSRVQIAYAGTTATYSKSSTKANVVADGDTLVWTISFNFYKNDLITYEFSSRQSTGSWKAFDEIKTIYTYKNTSEMK